MLLFLFFLFFLKTKGFKKSSFNQVSHIFLTHSFGKQMPQLLEDRLKSLILFNIQVPIAWKADTHLYQLWNLQIVIMLQLYWSTTCNRWILLYSVLSLVTGYNVWHDNEYEAVRGKFVSQRRIYLSNKAKKGIKLTRQKWAKQIVQNE